MINYNLKQVKAIVFDVDGVLSSETIPLHPDGEPMRTVNIKDGYAIQLAVKHGLRIGIITGGTASSVKKRYEGLGISDIYMGSAVKTEAYSDFKKRHNLADSEIMYMGDDIPDYEVMSLCGCPVCPKDAAADIKAISLYISDRRGGEGCGRDVIEQTLRAQGKWMADGKAFGW